MEDKNKNKSFSYRVGTAVGTVIVACVTAIIVALTLKLIGWILL